jgi:AcrR family transcriptional regulator
MQRHYEVAFLSESETKPDPMRERIIETALEVAEDSGWYNLRLHIVAQRLGVPLEAVLGRFRDADAIGDAWFARALQAVVQEPKPGFAALSPSERVHIVLMRWFEAQSRHHRVVCSMLRAKLHPSHPHHWVPMIFSLSGLIHWVLDAARLDARGLSARRKRLA